MLLGEFPIGVPLQRSEHRAVRHVMPVHDDERAEHPFGAAGVVFGAARLFGLDGIWLSVTAVQMVLSVAAAALLRYRHRARRPDRAAEPAASEAC